MPRSDARPPAPGRFLDAGGMRLHAESRGPGGTRLLALHGFLSSSAAWRSVLGLLGERLHAVALDLPGAGYSDRPPDSPYDLTWFADLLPEIAEKLGARSLTLAGHSLGGAVALHCAARHPELVEGLVLVSPLVYSPPPPPGLRLAKRMPGLARAFFSSGIGRISVAYLVQRAAFAGKNGSVGERARLLLGHLDAPGGWEAATKIGVRAAGFAPGAALLARVKQPCLVFWGKRDRVHPWTYSERLRADLAGPTKLVLWDDAGHNCHEEDAGRFSAETLAWIEAGAGSGAETAILPRRFARA